MTRDAIAMRVRTAGEPLVSERVQIEPPASGRVRVSVVACGVCRADLATAKGDGDVELPVTPGHEIAGVIAELGEGVDGWQVGERVAVGWFGGSCGGCEHCQRGDVVHCLDRQIPGRSFPGGWAESVSVPSGALVRVPEGLDLFDAAPMGCAGVTTFNAVRQAGVPAGGRVAVFGLGGLGHLAVQFAAKMGYEVVAIARGSDRQRLAKRLGAHAYIDSAGTAPGAALQASGGAHLIISTVPSAKPISELSTGLRPRGQLTLIGIDDGSIDIPADRIVMNAHRITGHLTGSPLDTEEAMRFAVLNDVRPMIERTPLEHANEALTRIQAGQPRCRVVLDATPER